MAAPRGGWDTRSAPLTTMRMPSFAPARVLVLALLWTPAAFAQPPTELHYAEVPPLMHTGPDGQPAGSLVEAVRRWWPAGPMPLLRSVPFKRGVPAVLQGQEPICLLGAFRTPEREAAARFSTAISQEPVNLVISRRAAAERVRAHADARSLVLDTELRLLLTDGASYGAELDAWLLERGRGIARVAVPPLGQLEMLLRSRADFILSDFNEAPFLLAKLGADAQELELVSLPGMPTPPTRHLMCNRRVSAEWLRAFDARVDFQAAAPR